MGLREHAAMWRHWSDHPPVPLMVAGYLGIKPRKKTGANQDADIEQLMSLFGAAPGQTATIR